jgi:hypothetical protein
MVILTPQTPEEYRDGAAVCERLADEAKDWSTREIILYVAMRWRALADTLRSTSAV